MGAIQNNYKDEDFCHYTSLEALKSIIETRTLRLTDYRFLNDPKELSFGFDLLEEAVNACGDLSNKEEIIETIHKFKNNTSIYFPVVGSTGPEFQVIQKEEEYRFYVFSLSYNIDSMQMWNSYGKDGVCIKLNSQKLFEYMYSFRDKYAVCGFNNINRGPVRYGNSKDEIIQFDEKAMSWIFSTMGSSYILNCKNLIFQNVAFVKHKGWSYENEYRIGFPLELSLITKMMKNNDLKPLFSQKNSIIIPQIELSRLPLEVVEEIIVSPYIDSELTIFSVENFVESFGIDSSVVKSSEIQLNK